jgi:pimeloyl-ACP methyl ester carboxylesterase
MTSRTTCRLSRLLALVVALLMLATGGLTAGAAKPAAQEATPAPAPAALVWTACGEGGWECATLSVPLDYADPTGPTIDLALTRLPAGDPARRIGVLLYIAGGPGENPVGILHEIGTFLFPDETRARFDIVGVDPRGVGASGQIDCRVDLDAYLAIDPSPDDDAEREAWLAGGRGVAAACAAHAGALLPYLGSENVVSDLERVRLALGEQELSALGVSYGTSVGARYADRYPDRVRALALDSALPSSVDGATLLPQWVAGYERSFDAFLADCAAALTCPFHAGGDPGAAFDALMTALDAAPLQVASESGGTRLVGQHAVLDAVDRTLSAPTSWPQLASALSAAVHGDGSAVLALADERNGCQPDGTYGPFGAFLAVSCLDIPFSPDPAAYEALAAKAATIAPRLGAYYATQVLPCAFWPASPTPAAGPPVAHGAPPILVIGATVDTQDPYQWSVDMAAQLESGLLLTREGSGHPSYFGSLCVENAVNAYLVDLTLPAPGTTCDSTGGLRERFA